MKRSARIKVINSINKQAEFSLTNMLLDGLSSTFASIQQDPITGIAQILLEGIIFTQLGWMGAIITTILDVGLGINVKSLFNAIKTYIIPFMTQNLGKSINVDSASTQLTNSVISSLNVSPTDANKTFGDVQQEKPELKSVGNLFSKNEKDIIVKEAFLGGLLSKLTLKGLIGSTIKALLIGAGFKSAGGAVVSGVKSMLGLDKETPKNTTQTTDKKDQPDQLKENTILKYVGKPSGDEESNKVYPNDAKKGDTEGGQSFYIISAGRFEDMMLDLVFRVYPNIKKEVARIIEKNFNKIVSQVKKEFVDWNDENIDQRGTYIRVPTQINGKKLNSFKDIVDLILSLFVIKQ